MKNNFLTTLIALGIFCNIEAQIPGRVESPDIGWIEFGSTDVFFYMSQGKYALTKKIVEEINQEKIKLTVDINDFDCMTTELSAIASKYPAPIGEQDGHPIYIDPSGNATLDSYASSLKQLIHDELNLNIEGTTREINFIVSQDAHKFHQDQSGRQFDFLNKRDSSLPPCKIIQDLTLVDWDMSVDTFSATIIQDSLSNDRFLMTLFPKESVGMLFTQSPKYLTREAHPSYSVPTIFPYHAVLSPIDMRADKTPGSSKGKRLSTVLRGVVLESEIVDLKQRAYPLSINRPSFFEDEKGKGIFYQNKIIARELNDKIRNLLNTEPWKEGFVYKHPDQENVEILEISGENAKYLIRLLGDQFGLTSHNTTFIRLIKKDGGFSSMNLMELNIEPDQNVVLLNSSEMPEGYDFFNLAEDCSSQMLPWIQLYHVPLEKAFCIPGFVFPKLSLTPVEEILFRKARFDSMKTDGITSSKKIVTKIDLFVFEKSYH